MTPRPSPYIITRPIPAAVAAHVTVALEGHARHLRSVVAYSDSDADDAPVWYRVHRYEAAPLRRIIRSARLHAEADIVRVKLAGRL